MLGAVRCEATIVPNRFHILISQSPDLSRSGQPIRALVVLAVLLFVCAGIPALASTPPVVDSFTSDPAVVAPGGIANLTVQAHDPDCADTCTTGCGEYIRSDLAIWSADGGNIIATDNGVSASPYTATAQWQAPEVEGVLMGAIRKLLKD